MLRHLHGRLTFGINFGAALLLAAALPLSVQLASAQTRMGNPAHGPTKIPNSQLDPGRNLSSADLESNLHKPVPTDYIWTKADAVPDRPRVANGWSLKKNNDMGPHYFRRTFEVSALPKHATLYIAGQGRQRFISTAGRWAASR